MLKTMWNRLTALFADARDDERGAIAVQFALLLIPIAILTFGLLDISRASVQRRQLQDAIDAATLMAARSTATTNATLDTIGDAALATELSGLGISITASSSTFSLGDSNTVVGTVSADIKPIISNLWSKGPSTVTATSVVTRSVNKLEVALVLDNTGSMGSKLGTTNVTKISSLTTAAQSLVTTLSAAAQRSAETDAVKISVVPFSMTVNIGSVYQGQTSWLTGKQLSGTDVFSTVQDRFTLLTGLGLSWGGCVESRVAPFDVTDAAPASSNAASMFVPFFAPDEPDDNVVNSTTNSNSSKYRDVKTVSNTAYPIENNWLPDVTAPTGTLATAWATRSTYAAKYTDKNAKANVYSGAKTGTDYGPNAGCGLTSLLRLTNVRNSTGAKTVTDKLGLMVADGNTNVAMGLMWGWHTLTPNAPFSDGVPYSTPHVSKVIVLLTDGDNTNDVDGNPNNSIYTGYGYIGQGRLLNASNVPLTSTSTAAERLAAIDSREARVCTNARAAGVLIYAIGVGVSSHSRTILQACASRSDMYYDVTDASQLTSVFNTIAGSIQNLHISK